ncbi:MAG TPA: hypothetical protein PKY82_23025 [Pyrinomonadaceae bacterium]|nr:hypothetical protein [Pyrinomonadaceae bacterium]
MFPKKGILRVLLIILAIAVSGSIIAQVTNQINLADVWSSSGLKQKPGNLKSSPNQINRDFFNNPNEIPDEIAYGQVFRELEDLNKKADDEEKRNNRDGTKFRNLYKEVAQLSNKQARDLDRIAHQTLQRLIPIENRAKQIIDRIHAKTPNGRLQPGQAPPMAPPELEQLDEQQKNIILQGVTELSQNFGQAEFARFADFVNRKIKTGIKKMDSK